MFEKDLYLSTQRQFRESTQGLGDIQMQWLSIALRVSTDHVVTDGRSSDGGRLSSGLLSLPSLEALTAYSIPVRGKPFIRSWG